MCSVKYVVCASLPKTTLDPADSMVMPCLWWDPLRPQYRACLYVCVCRTTMWWSFALQRWMSRLGGSCMSPCGPRESSTCRVLPSKTKTWWGPSESTTFKSSIKTSIKVYNYLSMYTIICLHRYIWKHHHKIIMQKSSPEKSKNILKWNTRRSLSS